MSLARAFTQRVRRSESVNEAAMPNVLTKSTSRGSQLRASQSKMQISAPVLLSTTNVHTFNAVDVATAHKLRKVSSVSSSSSRTSDSDSSSTASRSRGASFTDASSVASSPTSPGETSTFYHSKGPRRSKSSAELWGKTRAMERKEPLPAVPAIPAIPMRAPSHSKIAHEQLARKRSLQQMPTSRPQQIPKSVPPTGADSERRASIDMFRGSIDAHPFGRELEQLDEVAEEFGGAVRDAEREADLDAIKRRGLAVFSAGDYIVEILPLFSKCYEKPQAARWI